MHAGVGDGGELRLRSKQGSGWGGVNLRNGHESKGVSFQNC